MSDSTVEEMNIFKWMAVLQPWSGYSNFLTPVSKGKAENQIIIAT